jgi:hypothetical protein
MYSDSDISTPYKVTENYTAQISEISVGIYATHTGYVITQVGIEEEYNPRFRIAFKRYWLLKCVGKLNEISFDAIYDAVYTMHNQKLINCVNTNSYHVSNILKRITQRQIIEVEPTDILILIKALLTDKKLEITDSHKEYIHELFKNYDPEAENMILKSLYLALNFNLEAVVSSTSFERISEFNNILSFEEMPLVELQNYINNNKWNNEAFNIFEQRLIAHINSRNQPSACEIPRCQP